MKVLIIVQHYPPERGAVHLTRDLAADMAARGHDVRVVTALPNYPIGRPYPGYGRFFPTRGVEDGVEVVRVPAVMASNSQIFRRIIGAATFALSALLAAVLGRKPDVILASLPPPTLAPIALVLKWARRVPLVFLLRDVEPLISFRIRGLESQWWAKLAIELSMRLYAAAEHIVVVHASQSPDLLSWGVDAAALDVITHGVDCTLFDKKAGLRPARPLRREGRALALYCGTLGAAHDVPALLRSFADPRVRSLPLDLVLVGGGEHIELCRDTIKAANLDAVRLLPPVEADMVPALLMQADLLVMSYLEHEYPIPGMVGSKFYEYCAAGRPVLVHGPGMAAHLVSEIGNGWVCQAGDPNDLYRKLRSFLDTTSDALVRGALGRSYAEKHYDKRSRHDQWEGVLQATVNQARRRPPSDHGNAEMSGS